MFKIKSQYFCIVGLWLHIDTFTEQPAIIFKHKLLLILETSNSYISWSTYQQFNTLHSDYLRTPVIMVRCVLAIVYFI